MSLKGTIDVLNCKEYLSLLLEARGFCSSYHGGYWKKSIGIMLPLNFFFFFFFFFSYHENKF